MKARNTILLGLIAAALIAFGYFYEQHLPSTKERAETEAHVFNFDREQLQKIIITNSEEKIVIELKDHQWTLTSPVKDRADDAAVSQLISTAESLEKDSLIDLPDRRTDAINATLKEYGVARSNLRLKFEGKGEMPAELILGKDTAVEGKMYVRFDDNTDVFVISTDLKNQLAKKVDDFRDHKLSSIDPSRVYEVHFKTPAGEIALKKEGTDWEITKPLQARGDNARMADLLTKLVNCRIDAFLRADELGLVRATVKLMTDSSPLTLEIGQVDPAQKGKVHARLSSREGSYLLPEGMDKLVTVTPNDLRDRHLIRLEYDIVDRIHIEPAGAPTLTLFRSLDDWAINDPKGKLASRAEVERFLHVLKESTVSGFVTDVASELAKYGLDKPQLRVTFSSYASENTAESTKGERPVNTILFGKEDGNIVYARLEEEPFIVAVPKALLAEIPHEAIALQEPAVLSLDPATINSLVIQSGTQKSVGIVRAENGDWKLDASLPSPGLNKTAVSNIANVLAHLRAVRWVGSAKPEYGLENPRATIELMATEKRRVRLKLGAQNEAGMTYAAVDILPGVFLLARPDAETLLTPVAETSAASDSPSATATRP